MIMARIRVFWDEWGKSLTAGIGLIAGFSTGVYFFSERMTTVGHVERLAAEQAQMITQVQNDLSSLRAKELTGLEKKLVEIEGKLASASGRGSSSAGAEKVEAVSSSLEGVRESQIQIELKIRTIESVLPTLSRIENSHDQILREHGEIQRKTSDRFGKVLEQIGDLKAEFKRLDAILEILRPIITEGLALGRISSEDLTVLYTSEEIEALVEAADRLIIREVSPPGSGGGGGGGGGSGGRVHVADHTLGPNGNCVGVPRDCFTMSFWRKSPNGVTESKSKIEIYYGLTEVQYAFLLSSTPEVRLAEATAFEGRLCSWVSKTLKNFVDITSKTGLQRTAVAASEA